MRKRKGGWEREREREGINQFRSAAMSTQAFLAKIGAPNLYATDYIVLPVVNKEDNCMSADRVSLIKLKKKAEQAKHTDRFPIGQTLALPTSRFRILDSRSLY